MFTRLFIFQHDFIGHEAGAAGYAHCNPGDLEPGFKTIGGGAERVGFFCLCSLFYFMSRKIQITLYRTWKFWKIRDNWISTYGIK